MPRLLWTRIAWWHHWSVLFVVFLAFGPTVLSGCDAVYGNTSESVQGKCVHTVIA